MGAQDGSAEIEWPEAAVRLERAGLVRLCARLAGDATVAEDLAQEALLAAWRGRHTLRDPAARPRWLAGIARNICRRWVLGQRRLRARLVRAAGDGDPAALDLVDILAADVDLEAAWERRELAALLDRALALLPPDTGRLLVEHVVEGLPHAELAARRGLGADAVAMRVARGKLALRRALATRLADEAAAYGLLSPAEDAGWRETRVWCPQCGRRTLLIRFAVEREAIAFRCPACTPEPAVPMAVYPRANPSFARLLGGLRQPRAILRRTAAWAHAYFRGALERRAATCTNCGRPARLSLALRQPTAALLADPHALLIVCDRCGEAANASFGGLITNLPEVQRFWRAHRRLRRLPARELEAEGRPALATTLASVADAARLDVVVARDDLRVLRVGGDRS